MSARTTLSRLALTVLAVGLGTALTAGPATAAGPGARHCLHGGTAASATTDTGSLPVVPRPGQPACTPLTR